MLACYTDRTSVRPGETFNFHASATERPCRLEVAREGRERKVAHQSWIEVGDHPTPHGADQNGCGWPVAANVTVGEDWDPGYYDIALSNRQGETAHHFLCVKAPEGRPAARCVLVLTTNTLHAYNAWGGASAYAHVASLMAGQSTLETAMAGAIGRLSTQRPISPMLVAAPEGMPRLVNLTKRGFERRPWAGADTAWSKAHGQSPYDGSAGFLNKWEHAFVRWAETEGLSLDYLTDHDLDGDPGALAQYDVLVLVGHSEYWSGPQRVQIDQFIEAGGRLACFSGNTAFWKVRWEDEGKTLICHKWAGFEADPMAAADPGAGTHLWSHPVFGWPEAATTGLSFLFGGYHRLGL